MTGLEQGFFALIFLQLLFIMFMLARLRSRVEKLEKLIGVLLRSPH
jgi:hypothetical protein